MRHDAWRRDAAAYPLHGELLPRFADADIWQHLNNTSLITLHGEALQQALASVFGPHAWRDSQPVLACVSNATDFLLEAHYPAPLTWAARLTGVSADGLRVATALFQHGKCVGQHDTTLVGWADGAMAGFSDEQIVALRAAAVPGADALRLAAPAVSAGTATAADPAGMQDPAHYPWQTTMAMRFADSDARRLASDTCLARAAEQMRVEFLNQMYGNQRHLLGGMMVAHVALRWLRRDAPGPLWQLGCGVAHVGERSLAVRGAVFDAGHCVALCEGVMVVIDRDTRRSAPLTDGARALLEPFRLKS